MNSSLLDREGKGEGEKGRGREREREGQREGRRGGACKSSTAIYLYLIIFKF